MKRKLINYLVEFYWAAGGILALAVLYLLSRYVDDVREVNPALGAIVIVVIPFILDKAIKFTLNNWYIFKLQKTSSIADIQERIRAQESLLKANILDQSDEVIPKRMIKSKMMIYYTVALLCINVGDYKNALNHLERAAALSVRVKSGVDDLLAEGTALGVGNKCAMWEAVSLSALGEIDSAQRKIEPFMSRVHKLKQTDRATVWLVQTEIATRSGDIAKAREYHSKLDADIWELAEKFKRPDLVYDSMLFDGILDKMEGNFDSARQKLESVLKNTTSEGNRIRATRELNFSAEAGGRVQNQGPMPDSVFGNPVNPPNIVTAVENRSTVPAPGGHEANGGTAAPMPGWGPGRNIFSADAMIPLITFNSITNSPIGDERNFCNIRESGAQSQWSPCVEVFPGKEYHIRIYIHNNATHNLALVAENVRASIHLPAATGKIIDIHGFIDSTNATPNRIWSGARMYSGQDFNIIYMPNSAHLMTKHYPKGVAIPDSVFTRQGALIGYERLDGQIPGGFQYAAYLFITVRIS